MREFGSARRCPFLPCGEEEGSHRSGLPDAKSRDGWSDIAHGVVDGHAGRDDAAWRVDIEGDFLVGVFGFKEEELSGDEGGSEVFDGSCDEDDSLFEEAGIDIESALAAGGLLNDHGDKRIHGRGFRVHVRLCLSCAVR